MISPARRLPGKKGGRVQPFTFHNPTRIVFGPGTTARIGKETKACGRRALLLYGKGSAERTGVLGRVRDSLNQAGLQWEALGGVRPNPVLNFAREAIAFFRQQRLDVIVAVGGGSVIDTAKTIAAGARYDGEVWDFFSGRAEVKTAAPITTVLTLAATGSEMNSGGVITNEESQEKYHLASPSLYPQCSILDPVNTFTVPRDHSMYGAVDAMIHLLEGYFNAGEEDLPLQDRLVEGLLRTLMEAAEVVYHEPENYPARANLMWGATLALNGLTTAGTGNTGFPMHMIEHSLSAIYDIAHGAGLSIVGPAWMRYASARAPRKFAQFAERIFGIDQGTASQRAQAGIEALEKWFVARGVPTRLPEANIPEQDIPRIAANARRLAEVWGLDDYTQREIEAVLEHAGAATARSAGR